MACSLTQNLTVDCRDAVGGINAVWVLEASKVFAVTASNGTITGVSTSGSVPFWKYSFLPEKAGYSDPIVVSDNGNIYYTPTVTMIFNKLSVNTSNEIKLLAANTNLKVAVKDNNGSILFLGKENGLRVSEGNEGAGTAFGDLNGYNLTLTGGEPAPAYFATGSFTSTIFPGS